MLLMAPAGVLCAPHHCRDRKHVVSVLDTYGVRLFTKFADSALQRLVCGRMKSIFGRCIAARAKCAVHPEEVLRHASS